MNQAVALNSWELAFETFAALNLAGGFNFGLVIVIYAIIIFIEALYETMLYLGIEIDLLKKFFQSLGEYIIPPSSFGIVGHYIEALFMFVIGCSLIRGAIDAFKDN